MFAGFEGGDGGLDMLVPHRDDTDDVDFGVCEHVVIIGVRGGDIESIDDFFKAIGAARADGVDLRLGQVMQGFAVFFAKPSEPDDAAFNGLHLECS
jgi:hypothetical protein